MKQEIFASYKDWLNEQKMPKGKRAALLAALDLFAKNGYDGTATMEIAKQAGVSQATIFKYFKTKDDLLKAIMIPFVNNLLPDYKDDFLDAIPTEPTIRQMVHFFINNRYEFLKQNSEAIMIFFNEIITNAEVRTLFIQFAQQTEPQFLEVIYAKLTQIGTLRSGMTPMAVFRTIGGQLLTYFFQREKLLPFVAADEAADLALIETIVVHAISTEE
jgi:AcrR family transcriptional regulator